MVKKICFSIFATLLLSVVFFVRPAYAVEWNTESELFGPRIEVQEELLNVQPRFTWRGSVWRTHSGFLRTFWESNGWRQGSSLGAGHTFTVVSDVVNGRVQISGGVGNPQWYSSHWWVYISELPIHATRVSDGW